MVVSPRRLNRAAAQYDLHMASLYFFFSTPPALRIAYKEEKSDCTAYGR